jgi:hypothetical protein
VAAWDFGLGLMVKHRKVLSSLLRAVRLKVLWFTSCLSLEEILESYKWKTSEGVLPAMEI